MPVHLPYCRAFSAHLDLMIQMLFHENKSQWMKDLCLTREFFIDNSEELLPRLDLIQL
jgi:hypothetical protein